MKKHSLKIGNTAAICEVQASPMGAVWLESNEVVFDTFRSEPLRVSASGGEPTLIAIESAETGRQYSRAVRLPIPGKILSSSRSSGGEFRVEVVDLDSGETHPLVDDARAVGYAASGHLIFARAATLFAVPFTWNGCALRRRFLFLFSTMSRPDRLALIRSVCPTMARLRTFHAGFPNLQANWCG